MRGNFTVIILQPANARWRQLQDRRGMWLDLGVATVLNVLADVLAQAIRKKQLGRGADWGQWEYLTCVSAPP